MIGWSVLKSARTTISPSPFTCVRWDYLGLTIETVSRMMTSLARRGLIQATGRHSIALRKLSALRDIACRDEDEADVRPAPVTRAVWPN